MKIELLDNVGEASTLLQHSEDEEEDEEDEEEDEEDEEED